MGNIHMVASDIKITSGLVIKVEMDTVRQHNSTCKMVQCLSVFSLFTANFKDSVLNFDVKVNLETELQASKLTCITKVVEEDEDPFRIALLSESDIRQESYCEG
ncbi:hypothetical protein QAD02_009393 [Eretmocerus hayati]|uniref:Uncharacterized protein n=1 Tax=Eretmocerus hayati TaxID=131215 RepID=A0ACC2N966_9HYME|nr:hypothetical protein QAD02_009393 [Eretmocerus hayati]